MTTTLQPEWEIPGLFWVWAILALLPAIMAAGVLEKSSTSMTLPEEKTYRSNLSDTIMESSNWRIPHQEDSGWRKPSPPSVGWRTQPTPESNVSSSQRNRNLFPRYKSGNPTDFDYINREEKPQIKVFEFGS